ncbi:hypothetical protein [uncultured Desulfuromusa sp.]|uniref:hypothetical protein n=1 Tax=uncultured Desulfuromusa sp. TaxID=219183 RepID=UPI002AA8313F|nr:hypothetical protein [uncultured Desulfuromusa sp.]
MFTIIKKNIDIDFPRGHHLHCLICQIPNEIRLDNEADFQSVTQRKWQRIRSVLELITTAESNLKKIHFLLFPEGTLPFDHFDQALAMISKSFPNNTVTMLGLEVLPLISFSDLARRFVADNEELLQSVDNDRQSGDIDALQVNSTATIVKESSGKVRVFLQAKSHPCYHEEAMEPHRDLYHGKVFPLWHCPSTGFNFMAMICFDYIYRTPYQSNIRQIIDYANELYFSSRQQLDLLVVLECNPKPEHHLFRNVVHGFYGEMIDATPGVHDTMTVFCNASGETNASLPEEYKESFGHSSIIMHEDHKIASREFSNFTVDNFDGLPVCRLRFNSETRLFYFNLPVFHRFDPRTTRMPMKIHRIYQEDGQGHWVNMRNFESSDLNIPNPQGETP